MNLGFLSYDTTASTYKYPAGHAGLQDSVEAS